MTDDIPLLIRTLLRDPSCYDHPVQQVQLVETHISWVLLTGTYAYKIKKPVDLGFLDFSTLEKRHQACTAEVRLNQRLAGDIYQGVVAITGTPEAPRIGVEGTAFEYAVQMHQFPQEFTLDRLSERGELGIEHIDTLAARVGQFHLNECEAATTDRPWGKPEAILQPVMDNFRVLQERVGDEQSKQSLKRLQHWSLAGHERLVPLMHERVRTGKIRECHGDLHLGNLAWVDGRLVIFDCIEFNPALRWIDVMSEVAFCFMDLVHRNHRELAYRFLNAWLEVTGDYAGMALLRYYAVYRAMVRAKVAILRAEQKGATTDVEVISCLRLAEELARPADLQLWITHGYSGSGKTTASQGMLQKRGMIRVRSDVERKRLAGMDAHASSGSTLNEGLYATDVSEHTYAHLARIAESLLVAGWPVIVDATFLKRRQRDLLRATAQRCRSPFHILDMSVEKEVLRERISQRISTGGDASEADLNVLQHQIASAEPLSAEEMKEIASL